MSDVISRHGENRHLGDRAFATMKSPGAFVNRTQVCVHVSWISPASRNFLSGCRNLSESFRIVRHVGEYDEDVGSEFDREILGGCQCESWGEDSFDGWIVGEVDEHGYVVEGALFLEVVPEESGLIGVDAHGGGNGSERVVRTPNLGLPGGLSRDLVLRRSGGGEQWGRLAS